MIKRFLSPFKTLFLTARQGAYLSGSRGWLNQSGQIMRFLKFNSIPNAGIPGTHQDLSIFQSISDHQRSFVVSELTFNNNKDN